MTRFVALAVFLSSLAGCHAGNQAEMLSTPFPGTVLSAHATDGACVQHHCPFDYLVRITNPTGGDANVQECAMRSPSLRLPIMGIAGFGIPAMATRTVKAHFLLPIQKKAARKLVGQDVTCTGLDWHGNAPV